MRAAICILRVVVWSVSAQQPGPPAQRKSTKPVYRRLYYSVSLDGLHWKRLNGGRRVFEEYRGHSEICLGHDGRCYLVGNRDDAAREVNFRVPTT